MMKYRKIEGGEKLTTFIKPMLAQLTDRQAFDDNDWLFEVKWDGYRAVAEVSKSGIRLYSRNGLSFAKAYAKVYEALKKIRKQVILDGEIVVFDSSNKPNFQLLQNYTNNSSHPIKYLVFDLLNVEGKDISGLPLLERKAMLDDLLPKSDIIEYCDHVLTAGKQFFKVIQEHDLEGMIAKRSTSTYKKGARTTDWLKIKNVRSEEAVIIGFTEPKGSRKGFGSLLLGQYVRKKLTYIGNVGTGFNDKTLTTLHGKLKKITAPESPLHIPVKVPGGVTWVEPFYVCNIKFTEKTSDGIVRHPVFLGLRVDKDAVEAKPEKAKS